LRSSPPTFSTLLPSEKAGCHPALCPFASRIVPSSNMEHIDAVGGKRLEPFSLNAFGCLPGLRVIDSFSPTTLVFDELDANSRCSCHLQICASSDEKSRVAHRLPKGAWHARDRSDTTGVANDGANGVARCSHCHHNF